MDNIAVWLGLAAVVIVPLAAYAGYLLFKLRQQTEKQRAFRQSRIDSMLESIRTIAKAMEQQQCDISEGSLRICVLLESLPVKPLPDFTSQFPFTHELYQGIKHMPTHQARMAQDKKVRRAQDREREALEEKLEVHILKEAAILRKFSL